MYFLFQILCAHPSSCSGEVMALQLTPLWTDATAAISGEVISFNQDRGGWTDSEPGGTEPTRLNDESYPCVSAAVRRLRVSGCVAGLLLRGARGAQRALRTDGGAGGAFGGAARVVSGQNDGSDAPAGNKKPADVMTKQNILFMSYR